MDMDGPPVTAWLAVARAVHFACCLVVGGVWSFDRLVVGRLVPRWRRAAVPLLLTATPAVLASGAAWFVLVAAEMSGTGISDALRWSVLRSVWDGTQFGRAWQVHAAVWLAGSVTAGAWIVTGRGRSVGLALAAGLVGGLAWAGHGATGPAPAWHRCVDVLHLLASAVWPAGLVPFALVLQSLRRSADPDRWADLSRLARRFSAASLTAVGLLTATGLFDGWCLVGSVDGLLHTPYGRLLLAKVILFAGMVGLGAVNLLVLRPRLPAGERTARQLRLTVTTELLLGTAVVAAVGLLGLLEPPRV